MTAYFAPCLRNICELSTEANLLLRRCIKSWLASPAIVDIATAVGAVPGSLLSDFESYDDVAQEADILTRDTMFEWLESASSRFRIQLPNLAKTIAAVARRLASEASAERAFYAMRLTFTPERASMWPESVVMAVQALSFAKPSVLHALHHWKSHSASLLFSVHDHREAEHREQIDADATQAAGAAPLDDAVVQARSIARVNAVQAVILLIG